MLTGQLHWFNSVQYKDGKEITKTMLQGFVSILLLLVTPALQQHDILTTHTDYVNKYPSTLQTTCYNLSETDTSIEVSVGIVKSPGVHPKNPCQHAADLKMLEQVVELGPSFLNMETGEPDCIRMDGAGDEGPEVEFYWTERHIRCSDDGYNSE